MYSKIGEIREKAKELLAEKNFFTPIEIARALDTSRQYVHQAIDDALEAELNVQKKRGLGWVARDYTGPLPTNRALMATTQRKNHLNKFNEDVEKLRDKLDGCGHLSIDDVKSCYPGASKDRCRRLMKGLIEAGYAARPVAGYRQAEADGRLMNVVHSVKKAPNLIGGRAAEGTSKMALVRQHLLELKKSGQEFYVSAIAHDMDVNNGLVLTEIRRLVRAGEVEFIGAVKSRRNSPQKRHMFKFSSAPQTKVEAVTPVTEPEPVTPEPEPTDTGPITPTLETDTTTTEGTIELNTED